MTKNEYVRQLALRFNIKSSTVELVLRKLGISVLNFKDYPKREVAKEIQNYLDSKKNSKGQLTEISLFYKDVCSRSQLSLCTIRRYFIEFGISTSEAMKWDREKLLDLLKKHREEKQQISVKMSKVSERTYNKFVERKSKTRELKKQYFNSNFYMNKYGKLSSRY